MNITATCGNQTVSTDIHTNPRRIITTKSIHQYHETYMHSRINSGQFSWYYVELYSNKNNKMSIEI